MSPRKGRTHRVIPPLAKGRGQFCSVRERPEDDRYVSLTFDTVTFQKYILYNYPWKIQTVVSKNVKFLQQCAIQVGLAGFIQVVIRYFPKKQ